MEVVGFRVITDQISVGFKTEGDDGVEEISFTSGKSKLALSVSLDKFVEEINELKKQRDEYIASQKIVPNEIILNNSTNNNWKHYPRLQTNNQGHIVLATEKEGILTTGMLVGDRQVSRKNKMPFGQILADWEICGELTDYDGEVTITIKNEIKNGK